MKSLTRIHKTTKKLRDQNHVVEIPAFMGNLKGVIKADDNGNVNVTLFNGVEMVVRNDIAPTQRRIPVVVGYDKKNTTFRVLKMRESLYNPPYIELPNHADKNHQWPNSDTLWVRTEQILSGIAIPDEGLIVQFVGFVYRLNGFHLLDTQPIDFTSHIPVSGANYALVQVDDDRVISFVTGVSVASRELLTYEDIPEPSAGNLPLFAVKMYLGQTRIIKTKYSSDIVDLLWARYGSAGGDPAPVTIAANDFQVGDGAGAWIKKTLAEIKTILGLGNAAYKNTGTTAGMVAAGDDARFLLADKYPFEARLTLETGVYRPLSELVNLTELFLTKYYGNQVALYSGSAWSTLALGADVSIKTTNAQAGTTTNGNKIISGLTDTSQLVVGMKISGTNVGAASTIASIDSASQITGTVNSTGSATNTITFKLPANTEYDVFVFNNAGSIKLELLFGTFTRSLQDGIDVKAGDPTRRLVGTIYTTATDGQLNWSQAEKSVCNNYNTLLTTMENNPGYYNDNAYSSWTFSSTSWVEAAGGSGSRVKFVLCKPSAVIGSLHIGYCVAPAGEYIQFAIGWDTITVTNKQTWTGASYAQSYTVTDYFNKGNPAQRGSHYAAFLVSTNAGGLATAYGDFGPNRKGSFADPSMAGISVTVFM